MLSQLKQITYSTFSDYNLSVVPLFLLMGQFAAYGGISGKLFATAENWLGHRRGGLAMATIGACAGFGAICGSSMATAATMARWRCRSSAARLFRCAVDRHTGGRRHARHPHPALDHPGHLRHAHRAEHRQAVRRRLRAGPAGGHRLHDRHPHLRLDEPGGGRCAPAAHALWPAHPRARPGLGHRDPVRGRARRHLWRLLHADRGVGRGRLRRRADRAAPAASSLSASSRRRCTTRPPPRR